MNSNIVGSTLPINLLTASKPFEYLFDSHFDTNFDTKQLPESLANKLQTYISEQERQRKKKKKKSRKKKRKKSSDDEDSTNNADDNTFDDFDNPEMGHLGDVLDNQQLDAFSESAQQYKAQHSASTKMGTKLKKPKSAEESRKRKKRSNNTNDVASSEPADLLGFGDLFNAPPSSAPMSDGDEQKGDDADDGFDFMASLNITKPEAMTNDQFAWSDWGTFGDDTNAMGNTSNTSDFLSNDSNVNHTTNGHVVANNNAAANPLTDSFTNFTAANPLTADSSFASSNVKSNGIFNSNLNGNGNGNVNASNNISSIDDFWSAVPANGGNQEMDIFSANVTTGQSTANKNMNGMSMSGGKAKVLKKTSPSTLNNSGGDPFGDLLSFN